MTAETNIRIQITHTHTNAQKKIINKILLKLQIRRNSLWKKHFRTSYRFTEKSKIKNSPTECSVENEKLTLNCLCVCASERALSVQFTKQNDYYCIRFSNIGNSRYCNPQINCSNAICCCHIGLAGKWFSHRVEWAYARIQKETTTTKTAFSKIT